MSNRSFLTAALLLLGCSVFAARLHGGEPALQQLLERAPLLRMKEVCTPVRSSLVGMTLWAPNSDGKTWDLLQIYFPKYGGPNTIVIVDFGSGQVKKIETAEGLNFHLCPSVTAKDGRLFISILDGKGRVKICIYNPTTNELTIDAVPMPEDIYGETHPLILAPNGKIYAFGAHPSRAATACEIDPARGKVRSLGVIGPSHEPSGCWAYSAAADDRYLYVASGKVPWYLVAYELAAGKSEVLVTTEKADGDITAQQYGQGAVASAIKVLGTDGARREYWLTGGKVIPRGGLQDIAAPWGAASAPVQACPPKPEISLVHAAPASDGTAELWFRTSKSRAVASDAFSLEGKDGWRGIRYSVPVYAEYIFRMFELPDGRIMGSAGSYEGLFVFEPKSGICEHVGRIWGLSHYATVIKNGKVYLTGYPSSALYEYDPSKAWTLGKANPWNPGLPGNDRRNNPRMLAYLSDYAKTHKIYSASEGADGKLYFGGIRMRSGSGGGFAWWDPEKESGGGLWTPFSSYQVFHLASADKKRYIVLSTYAVRDTLLDKPEPTEGKLFVYDTRVSAFVREIVPVAGAKTPGLIAGNDGPFVLGWTTDGSDVTNSVLYSVNVITGEVRFRRKLNIALPVPLNSNQRDHFDFRKGPDGKIWTFLSGYAVKIDPENGRMTVIGSSYRSGSYAFAGTDCYMASGPGLYSIKTTSGIGQ